MNNGDDDDDGTPSGGASIPTPESFDDGNEPS